MTRLALVVLLAVLTAAEVQTANVKTDAVARQVLPGMIFVPVFLLFTVMFIILRAALQTIRDRQKRPLNPPDVVERMTTV